MEVNSHVRLNKLAEGLAILRHSLISELSSVAGPGESREIVMVYPQTNPGQAG